MWRIVNILKKNSTFYKDILQVVPKTKPLVGFKLWWVISTLTGWGGGGGDFVKSQEVTVCFACVFQEKVYKIMNNPRMEGSGDIL